MSLLARVPQHILPDIPPRRRVEIFGPPRAPREVAFFVRHHQTKQLDIIVRYRTFRLASHKP